MYSIEPLKDDSLRGQSLIAEIRKLGDQQNELLKKAAFVGMTREEAKKFDEVATQIAKLVKELETLAPVGSYQRSHHEQEAEEVAWDR